MMVLRRVALACMAALLMTFAVSNAPAKAGGWCSYNCAPPMVVVQPQPVFQPCVCAAPTFYGAYAPAYYQPSYYGGYETSYHGEGYGGGYEGGGYYGGGYGPGFYGAGYRGGYRGAFYRGGYRGAYRRAYRRAYR